MATMGAMTMAINFDRIRKLRSISWSLPSLVPSSVSKIDRDGAVVSDGVSLAPLLWNVSAKRSTRQTSGHPELATIVSSWTARVSTM